MMKNVQSPFPVRMENSNGLPSILSFESSISISDFVDFYKSNEEMLVDMLTSSGAVLFKGINIQNRKDFHEMMKATGNKFNNYIDGNSPRTKLSDIVYTSTEYDASMSISMHNELSYSARWPSKLFFCCIVPAKEGGQTPIADGREVYKLVDKDLVKEIEEKGIIYYRNLHGGDGFGPSWQDTFETADRREVEEHCKNLVIDFEWKPDDSIRLRQHRKGIIQHPISKEKVWFNQMDQFHPFHLGEEIYNTLMSIYSSVEDLPTYVSFGDKSPISNTAITHVQDIFNKVSVVRPWEKADLLMIDNVLVSHGRKPYTGNREILVSMIN